MESPLTIIPSDIMHDVIAYLDPNSAVTLYCTNTYMRSLFKIKFDIKTAVRTKDIVSLIRLSNTHFPIDKELYVLACASGINKFVELLEERDPRTRLEYKYIHFHGCLSWLDAGIVAAIRNHRVKMSKKLLARKNNILDQSQLLSRLYHTIRVDIYDIALAGCLSGNKELIDLTAPFYNIIASNDKYTGYEMSVQMAYTMKNDSLINPTMLRECVRNFEVPYYRAMYSGEYDQLNRSTIIGLCDYNGKSILEEEFPDISEYGKPPTISDLTYNYISAISYHLGIGQNIKVIRNYMQKYCIEPNILCSLDSCSKIITDYSCLDIIIREIFKHWRCNGFLDSQEFILRERKYACNVKIIKRLYDICEHDYEYELVKIMEKIIVVFPRTHMDKKKHEISFAIDKGLLIINTEEKAAIEKYIEDSGDTEMQRLLNKIPVKK